VLNLKGFTEDIENALEVGTERTLYKPLGNFLESFIKDSFEKEITTFAEQSSRNYAKKVGFPDIAIKEKNLTLGYIELKLPSDSLDNKSHKNQFDKYKNSLDNIIFTNLKSWQLYQWDNSSKSKKVLEVLFDYENPDISELKKIFEKFLSYQVKRATSSNELATNLAKRTRVLSEIIESLVIDNNHQITTLKEGFKKSLLHDITDKSFSNLIAETFTYSLFIASIIHNEKKSSEPLTVTTALDYIPKSIPIIYDLYDLSKNLSRDFSDIKDAVELILKELNFSDLKSIIESFSKSGDPILHFYEPFLKAYDPQTKKERGAFYTPKPVVDFIVRETDKILQNEFNLDMGFGEKSVKVLDPATGTGTFFSSLIDLIKEKIDSDWKHLEMENEKFKEELQNHILKSFYGFEFMVAPYTVAHLKLLFKLRSLDVKIQDDQRFQIYLANTLDDPSKEPNSLLGFNIAEESRKATKVKNDKSIIAIIGNPPYSGTSQNPSRTESTKPDNKGKELTWIGDQIEKYKWNGSKKLDEKNPKWLQDDYVKFIRFAQYQIDSKDRGVVSYIVPHGFLDNPTFRYMRKSLLDSFSKIYLIDLHGNSTKKEKTPNGRKDENVFDIKQGVTLAFFVKSENSKECRVFHGDIYGTRKKKFAQLTHRSLEKICKTELFPKDDMFYFIPRNTELEDSYNKFWSVKDIFDINSVGIVTARDNFTIKNSADEVEKTINSFVKMESEEARNFYKLGKDVRDWKVDLAKKDLLDSKVDKSRIVEISYRPFDNRFTYYTGKSKGFHCMPRGDVMKHLLKENIGLVTNRQVTGNFYHSFITDKIMESSLVSNKSREISYAFPLYKYSDSKDALFETKEPNFTEKFLDYRKEKLLKYSDEEIFYYIYGLPHSPKYRETYKEFLQTDFPKIDFNRDILKVSEIGKELADLHLLKHQILNRPKEWQIQKSGKNLTLELSTKSKVFNDGKITFNSETYIGGISDEVWNFFIGGYQVLHKWLSDRNGKTLTTDELIHYMKIVVSIQKTIKFQKKLDTL